MIFILFFSILCKGEESMLCNSTSAKLDSVCVDRRLANETENDKPLRCSRTGPTQHCECNSKLLKDDAARNCLSIGGDLIIKYYKTLVQAAQGQRSDLVATACKSRRTMRECIVKFATVDCASSVVSLITSTSVPTQSDYYTAIREITAYIVDAPLCRGSASNFLTVCPDYCAATNESTLTTESPQINAGASSGELNRLLKTTAATTMYLFALQTNESPLLRVSTAIIIVASILI